MAYEYRSLGWSDEDVESVSASIDSDNNLAVAVTLKDGTTKESEPVALPTPEEYILPVATSTALGGIKSQTAGTDGTDYPVEVDSEGNAKVNVPTSSGGSTVIANPTLDGTESDLTGIEVDGTKYKVPSGTGSGIGQLYQHIIVMQTNEGIVHFYLVNTYSSEYDYTTLLTYLIDNFEMDGVSVNGIYTPDEYISLYHIVDISVLTDTGDWLDTTMHVSYLDGVEGKDFTIDDTSLSFSDMVHSLGTSAGGSQISVTENDDGTVDIDITT